MHKLRDYQERALKQFERRPGIPTLIVSPTGSGKGTMTAFLLAKWTRAGKRCLLLVHRRELVSDMSRRLMRDGVFTTHGYYTPGKARVMSVQAALFADIEPPDLLVVDEAHHYAADEWAAVVARLQPKHLLGFTATPQRADGRPLGDMFDRLINAIGYAELLRRRLIVPCRVLRPRHKLATQEIARDPAEAYLSFGRGERALIFVPRVDEAQRVRDALRRHKVRTEYLHSRTPRAERLAIMARLERGDLDVVANVGILTEGVDVPHVSCIVLSRPCTHVSTYLQIVGRALRAATGKRQATLIDLVGTSFVHGLPHEDRVYELTGSGIRLRGKHSGPSGPSGERDADYDQKNLELELEEVPAPDPAVSIREQEHPGKLAVLKGGWLYLHDGDKYAIRYTENGQNRGIGLNTTDEEEGRKLLAYFMEHGPEKTREKVRFNRRKATPLLSPTRDWQVIQGWNDERTKKIKVYLSTRSRKQAEWLLDLYNTDRAAFNKALAETRLSREAMAERAAQRCVLVQQRYGWYVLDARADGERIRLGLSTKDESEAEAYRQLYLEHGVAFVRIALARARSPLARASVFHDLPADTWRILTARDEEGKREYYSLGKTTEEHALRMLEWFKTDRERFMLELGLLREKSRQSKSERTRAMNLRRHGSAAAE